MEGIEKEDVGTELEGAFWKVEEEWLFGETGSSDEDIDIDGMIKGSVAACTIVEVSVEIDLDNVMVLFAVEEGVAEIGSETVGTGIIAEIGVGGWIVGMDVPLTGRTIMHKKAI